MAFYNMFEIDDIDIIDDVDAVDIVNENVIHIPRHIYIRNNLFETLCEKRFFARFRLSKDTTLYLLNLIEEHLEYPEQRNNSISPLNQLLLTLRFYATGEHLISIGDFIEADKSTVCRVVARVSRIIANLREMFIYMPRNNEEIINAQNNFYDVAGFPKVIGCVDGTHIRIISPGGNDAEIFRNRKSYFSVNVQIIASADYKIQDIVARWPGSTHDSTIFNSSRIKFRFENGDFGNNILLGDSGYMNYPFLFTPFLDPATRGQENYNISHKSTRVKVENTIGIWKRRFPVMAYGCRLKLRNTLPVIIATAVLQNIAAGRGEPEPPNEDIMDHELQRLIVNGYININYENENNNNNNNDYRQTLVDNYFSP